ncbi:endoglucanase 12 [Tanacetum coccineum]
MCNTDYCGGHIFLDPYDYNSTGYNDEYMWGTTWMYFATDDDRYLWLAVKEVVPNNVRRIFHRGPSQSRVLGWENKWPAAMLLLTSFGLFYQPGSLYDRRLDAYHNATWLTMCSYLQQYQVFNWTQDGLHFGQKPDEYELHCGTR